MSFSLIFRGHVLFLVSFTTYTHRNNTQKWFVSCDSSYNVVRCNENNRFNRDPAIDHKSALNQEKWVLNQNGLKKPNHFSQSKY